MIFVLTVIRAMYDGVTIAVRMKDGESGRFEVKVGVHQGLVLSPLLFIMVLGALPKEFCVGLSLKLFYADDLCLIAETEEELVEKIKCWKDAMKLKGLRVSMDKTKVMCCKVRTWQADNSGREMAVCSVQSGSWIKLN
jgi:hypothetical protein